MTAVPNPIIEADLQLIVQANLPWQKLAGKRVLITGASGFLPAYLVETLLYLNRRVLAQPVHVIALVRNYAKAAQRFAAYAGDECLSLVTQDVCQPILTKEEIHYIVHAASQASPKYYGTDPVGTLSANVLGTINIMQLAQRQSNLEGVMYFSSSEVYGALSTNALPVSENQFGYLDPTNVRSCYAESKRMGENICVSWGSQFGLPVTIVRPFHTYGPGMALDDGRVYADFVRDALAGQNIKMQSSGTATRAFCYLSDATLGFFTVLLQGIPGQAYNVGNPTETYTILELARAVASLAVGGAQQVVEFKPPTDGNYLPSPVNYLSPDISKLEKLGWHPSTTIVEGFARTIASYS